MSGISSISGNSGYTSMVSNLLQLQSVSKTASYKAVNAVNSVSSTNSNSSAYSDITSFLKTYQSDLTKLESSAAKLQASNSSSVFSDLEAVSSKESVATVSSASRWWKIEAGTDIQLDVQSLAKAQENRSVSRDAYAAAEEDIELNIVGASWNQQISVSKIDKSTGTLKNSNQMYQEVAEIINNNSSSGVKASVEKKDGEVSLILTAKETGEKNSFTVSSKTGALKGLEQAQTEASDAVYTVTQNGYSQTSQSSSNRIGLDNGKIIADLKSTGTTNIFSGIDAEKVISSVEDLVKDYNSVVSLLEENSGRGTAASAHLSSFQRGMGDRGTLSSIGITYDKSGNLTLNKEKLLSALETDYQGTVDRIGGQFGIASSAANKADRALSESVQRIVNNDLSNLSNSSSSNTSALSSGLDYFSRFASSGAYNLSNYYAIGMLFNTTA